MIKCSDKIKQLFGILLLGGIAVTQSVNAIPKLDIQLDIDPHQQFLQVTTAISGLEPKNDRTFYLNKDFTITSVKADGKKANFKFDLKGEAPPYVDQARPLTVKEAAETIEITYSGHIREIISRVNMVSPDLIELALYSAYFPFGIPEFEYTLKMTLPTVYKVVTNGKLINKEIEGQKTKYVFHSIGPSMDVPIIASPSLVLNTQQLGKARVEMFYSKMDAQLAEKKIEDMGKALKSFEKCFGEIDGSGLLRFAYSPRGGWGYSRLPLFVVSEEKSLNTAKKPFGYEKDSKYNAHELAHFWWRIADTNTNNDWINEGLAEYSSMSFATEQYGEEFRKSAINGYISHIRKAKSKISIVDTTNKSPDRYVNWYEKSALLLHVAELKFGKQKMNAFLSALYKKHRGTKLATTDSFFMVAKDYFNKEEYLFLGEYLRSPGWSEDQLRRLADAGNFKDLLQTKENI